MTTVCSQCYWCGRTLGGGIVINGKCFCSMKCYLHWRDAEDRWAVDGGPMEYGD